MKELSIHTATIQDLDSVMEVETLCFGADAFNKRQLAYLITESRGPFYVAKENDRVVGYTCMLVNWRSGCLRIYSLAVHPERQGRGIAQQLLNKAFEYQLEKACPAVSLEVNVNNKPAISLYEKNGFKIISSREGYYTDGSSAFRMQRKI